MISLEKKSINQWLCIIPNRRGDNIKIIKIIIVLTLFENILFF